MDLTRTLKHLFMPPWRVRSLFPPSALAAIEAEIARGEATHAGQVRFAVEAALDLPALWRGESARERAVEVFSMLRVWDTERNNGVLIYLLLADHDVEILADRGVFALVGAQTWARICQDMERAFREGRFEAGVIAGVRAVNAELARHYPRGALGQNELPDAPVLL